ncbi:MAG: chemotaxis protein CheD [Bryobacteraceae bacterium]|nr:chemotaxis protein CheD [Bryobacteraceae bacterium]
MELILVGIGDCRASRTEQARLITYALGSCIGMTVWDPVVKVGGLLHYLLPDSNLGSGRGSNPALYADTGIPMLLRKCFELGACRERLIIRAAGGARILSPMTQFDVGNQNQAGMRKSLRELGLAVQASATGGTECRTISLDVTSGVMRIREGGAPWKELTASRRVGLSATR